MYTWSLLVLVAPQGAPPAPPAPAFLTLLGAGT